MKRYFYYLEAEDTDGVFEYLDEQVDEGYIGYKTDDIEGIVIIESYNENNDDIFDKLVKKYDLLEDLDYEDSIDEDYDDFYNEDDYET